MRTLLALFFVLVLPARAANAPQWLEVRSPHFVIVTDSNEKQARKIAGQFERMRSLFQTVLPHGGGDASLPITVLALKDRKGFQSLVPAAYLAKGQIQLDGLFLRTQDRNYILLRLDAEGEHPFSIVYHEYTHFVLRKADWIPLWLNEGLAEFYQNTEIQEKGVHLGQPSADNILYLRQQRLLPLATLFAVDHNSPYYHDEQKGSVFYAESWALVHFLKITDFRNKTDRIAAYARLLVQHQDPVTAARNAFGDLGVLQKSLGSYVSNADFQMFAMNATYTADEASFQARPISLSDANAVRADVLASNDRRPEAQTLLDAVLRDDPKNALAHETMGSLAQRDHDMTKAKKWYGEAVALNSQSYLANYNYAVLSLMTNETGKDASIEASLRQAIKLEPTFAAPYDALAQLYGMRDEKLDEAHMLSLQAVQFAPTEIRYRINAAQIVMRQHHPENALTILRAAREIAKSDSDIGMIDRQIQSIESYQSQVKRMEQQKEAESSVEVHRIGETPSTPEPRPYPTTAPSGPRKIARGLLHEVHCSYPTVLTLRIEQPGKPLSLYTNNYFKIPFTTSNFIAKDDLDPCKGIEGMKAKVEYTTVTDERVAGQIIAIELSK